MTWRQDQAAHAAIAEARRKLGEVVPADDALARVRTAARRAGWLDHCAQDTQRSTPGFPGLVLCRAPRLLFLHLIPNGIPEPSQAAQAWIDELNASETVEAVPWWPRDWASLEANLRRTT